MNNSDQIFWKSVVSRCISNYATPFYIFSDYSIENSISQLQLSNSNYLVKHWYSLKTLSIPHVLRKWKELGYGVEIVSEYEFKAALKEGFNVSKILVNGVAKHTWLTKYQIQNLQINIDSINEFISLAQSIIKYKWKIGLRINVTEEFDPDEPEYKTQFGLTHDDLIIVLEKAKELNIKIWGLHFHLRTNISTIDCYFRSINELSKLCSEFDIEPYYIDIGGGLPSVGESLINSTKASFDYGNMNKIFKYVRSIPSVKELWLENGRYITARSGVLVVKILDAKQKSDSRYLICDSGRTNNCLPSDWEEHDFFLIPEKEGKAILTTVCGPTCMSYDHFFRKKLSKNISVGDYFIWMNAGAYHKSWETRFSKGLITVLYYCSKNDEITIAREAETFEHWWDN